MPQYRVSVLETWERKGVVDAKSPEEAVRLVEAPDLKVTWLEASFVADQKGSIELYDSMGNKVYPLRDVVCEGQITVEEALADG